MTEEQIKLELAKKNIEQALELIGQVWTDNILYRTPRMAESISLLDRGQLKLRKEIDSSKEKV